MSIQTISDSTEPATIIDVKRKVEKCLTRQEKKTVEE